jgi:hypothetical protein
MEKRPFFHINPTPYITIGIALWKTVPQYLGGRFSFLLHLAMIAFCQDKNLKKTKSNSSLLENPLKPFKAKFTVFHCADPIHLLECINRCSHPLTKLILVFVHEQLGREHRKTGADMSKKEGSIVEVRVSLFILPQTTTAVVPPNL